MKTVVIASVEYACQVVGSQRALAKLLGVSPGLIYQWTAGIRGVSIRHCQAIVELTNGHVTVQDLRPYDWHLVWPAPDCTTTKHFHISRYDPNEGNVS